MKDYFYSFVYDEEGASTLEVAIISVTLAAIAILFRKQLLSLAKAIADRLLG